MGVDLGSGGLIDRGDRGFELGAADLPPDCLPQGGQSTLGWIQKNGDGVTQIRRGDVEGRQRPQAFLSAGPLRAPEQGGEELVEKVQGVVGGSGFELAGGGEQGGVTSGRGHPGDRLCLGRGGVPRQGGEPARWYSRKVDCADP